MRIAFGLAAILTLSACSIGKDVPIAEQGVKRFHQMLGSDQIDAIVASSGPELTAGPAKARFTQLLSVIRKKLGRPTGGTQAGWNDNFNAGGHFISLNYQSKYERGDAAENFVFRMEGEKPTLAGYHINSDALILN